MAVSCTPPEAEAHETPTEAVAHITEVTGHRATLGEIRFCRLAGGGAPFVACLHSTEGHAQWLGGHGTPGHTWARYQREARQLRRYLTPPIPFEANWDRVAACESGGNWSINTGNGFYGGLQFDYGTWLGAGGGRYAQRADLASKRDQILIAELVRGDRGLSPWPTCGPRWYG